MALVSRARLRMVSAKLDARITDGATCVRKELPIVLNPWHDPFFDETLRQWTG